jgi:hypothetical protein
MASYVPGELIPSALSGSIPELPHVAKVAEAPLWNSNLKQSNRGVRTFESLLRVLART